MSEVIKLAGREYALCQQTTLRQDTWVQGLMSQAGVTLDKLQRKQGESALDFATRVTATTVESGLATRIIAGMLFEINAPPLPHWTPEYAEAIAGRLDNITDPADKERFRAQQSSLVAGFFAVALQTSMRFRSYSASAPEAELGQLPAAPAANAAAPTTPNTSNAAA